MSPVRSRPLPPFLCPETGLFYWAFSIFTRFNLFLPISHVGCQKHQKRFPTNNRKTLDTVPGTFGSPIRSTPPRLIVREGYACMDMRSIRLLVREVVTDLFGCGVFPQTHWPIFFYAKNSASMRLWPLHMRHSPYSSHDRP